MHKYTNRWLRSCLQQIGRHSVIRVWLPGGRTVGRRTLQNLLLEAFLKLVHRIAVVVRIPRLIAHAEDRDLLTIVDHASSNTLRQYGIGKAQVIQRHADYARRKESRETRGGIFTGFYDRVLQIRVS